MSGPEQPRIPGMDDDEPEVGAVPTDAVPTDAVPDELDDPDAVTDVPAQAPADGEVPGDDGATAPEPEPQTPAAAEAGPEPDAEAGVVPEPDVAAADPADPSAGPDATEADESTVDEGTADEGTVDESDDVAPDADAVPDDEVAPDTSGGPVDDEPDPSVPEAAQASAPGDETPGDETPSDESAVDESPVDDAPAEEAPVDEARHEGDAVDATVVDDEPVVDDADDTGDTDDTDTDADRTDEAGAADGAVPAAEPDTDEIPLPAAAAASTAEPRPTSSTQHRPRERARSRLLSAMRPKANRGQLLAALLCAGLGFGLVVQVRATQTEELDQLRQSDLVRLLQQVNDESEKLASQEAQAQAVREDIVGNAATGQVTSQLAKERLEALGVLTGTVAATGPGIELVITDPKNEVDAATLLDTLQELRDAGAEAVQIGPVRVVASTAFEDLDGGVRVGAEPVTPPYRYLVIGDPQTLSAAMNIPGGVLDVLAQKGAKGEVNEVKAPDRVEITALHVLPTPQYARPAQDGAP
ncbi:DUF881 domain-containing protein [Kineosporia sp. A_224]|uniref:DUF881 domain-containing protein n=1 Tax=Kineosporia sp. A_224 TaxID=1962180 RepID=UPI00117B81BE|nr:DUF881 domain-containing protein [Kineosporia sp. A_224]